MVEGEGRGHSSIGGTADYFAWIVEEKRELHLWRGPKNKQLVARVSASASSPALIVMLCIDPPLLFCLVLLGLILIGII